MNVTVINVKELIKYTIGLISIVFIVILGTNHFTSKKNNNTKETIKIDIENFADIIINKSFLSCIDTAIPMISSENKDDNGTEEDKTILKEILKVELGMIESVKENNEQYIKNERDEINNEKEIELAKTGLATEIILDKNLEANYTNTNGKVQVKNRTGYDITEDLMKADYSLDNNKDILLFHTHTCESYTPSQDYEYQMTGNYRTTDLNYSVAKVGDELENQLKEYGFNIIHDKTYHDYPSYSGSYDRSYATVTNILERNPGVQAAFDIHRDAVGNGDDYGPTVKIGDETVAQLMFVIGTDASGLIHPNWRQNFKFAVKIQEKANQMYPGLFRPINLSTSRYNQQISSGAVIIEVGATANKLEECIGSMKYLAKVISEVMK